jgi:hypothetical protein
MKLLIIENNLLLLNLRNPYLNVIFTIFEVLDYVQCFRYRDGKNNNLNLFQCNQW